MPTDPRPTLRKLEPGEESKGVHNIEAVADDGTVLARYECPCDWCQVWRAALPDMERAVAEMESTILGGQ